MYEIGSSSKTTASASKLGRSFTGRSTLDVPTSRRIKVLDVRTCVTWTNRRVAQWPLSCSQHVTVSHESAVKRWCSQISDLGEVQMMSAGASPTISRASPQSSYARTSTTTPVPSTAYCLHNRAKQPQPYKPSLHFRHTRTMAAVPAAREVPLDPKYDHYDFPTVSPTAQSGHPGHTTAEQDAQIFQLRSALEAAGHTKNLDTLTLVCVESCTWVRARMLTQS